MSPSIRATLLAIGVLVTSTPALAESQSSNSSSNCSNGRCQRVERFVVEDDRGRRGYTRTERWQENERRRRDEWRRADRQRWNDRRRGRDDDDDDD